MRVALHKIPEHELQPIKEALEAKEFLFLVSKFNEYQLTETPLCLSCMESFRVVKIYTPLLFVRKIIDIFKAGESAKDEEMVWLYKYYVNPTIDQTTLSLMRKSTMIKAVCKRWVAMNKNKSPGFIVQVLGQVFNRSRSTIYDYIS